MSANTIETVFVAGASGGTGREILRLLGPRDPSVTALTRSPEKRDELLQAGADDVVVDDLLNPSALVSALADVDVVLSTVGSGVHDLVTSGPYVDGVGTRTLLTAAVEADVEAFVMESALGVGDEPASSLARIFNLVIAPIQRAKGEAEAAVRDASVQHTIFRPGMLTNGPRTDDVTVAEPGAKLWGLVSRADIARLMVSAPVTDAAANRTFEVVAKPRFPERALPIEFQLP